MKQVLGSASGSPATSLGLYLLDEPATLLRLACILLILLGMIGLKLSS